jgi:hypothetical protein
MAIMTGTSTNTVTSTIMTTIMITIMTMNRGMGMLTDMGMLTS